MEHVGAYGRGEESERGVTTRPLHILAQELSGARLRLRAAQLEVDALEALHRAELARLSSADLREAAEESLSKEALR